MDFNVKFKDFKIQNIVGSCDVKFPVRLERLNADGGFFAVYDPESFPGLVFKMLVPKVCILVFVSGKVVLTGAKDKVDVLTAFENIYPMLLASRSDV